MSEQPENAATPREPAKQWAKWSVVSMNDGTLRCKRTNVADEKDVEYREVPKPVFSPEELAAMAEFASYGLLSSVRELTTQCYHYRYRSLAFRLCDELNTPTPNGTK